MLVPRLKNNGKVELWLNKLQVEIRNRIEYKIKSGIYKFETHSKCVICGSTDSELIAERDRYGLYNPVRICKNCGLVFNNPRMNQAAYNEFYNKEYRKLYLGTETPTDHFFAQQHDQGKRIYEFLNSNGFIIKNDKHVLEIGCGAGGILQFFREKGFEVQGIDLGEEYINYGKDTYGLDLQSASLKDFGIKVKPDIIIYSHVLEHLLNLNEELELVRKISHENTKLYIEVPSLKQMHIGYDINIVKYLHIAHTYHFTLTSLTNLLRKNSFELLYGTEYVQSVFRVSKGEKTELVNDYEPARNYILQMEKRRWMYYFTPRAIRYYSLMPVIKLLDKLGLKEKVKALLGK